MTHLMFYWNSVWKEDKYVQKKGYIQINNDNDGISIEKA